MTINSGDGDEVITREYKGFTFKVTQSALTQLKEEFGVDAIAEIERGINLALNKIDIQPKIDFEKGEVALTVLKLSDNKHASFGPGSDTVN